MPVSTQRSDENALATDTKPLKVTDHSDADTVPPSELDLPVSMCFPKVSIRSGAADLMPEPPQQAERA